MEIVDWRPRKWAKGTRGLTLEQAGVYIHLINETYLLGGPLPDDARWLAGVCNCSMRKFRQLRDQLISLAKITVLDDGRLSPNRCMIEIDRAQARIEQRRKARGARGGNKGKQGDSGNGRSDGGADAAAAAVASVSSRRVDRETAGGSARKQGDSGNGRSDRAVKPEPRTKEAESRDNVEVSSSTRSRTLDISSLSKGVESNDANELTSTAVGQRTLTLTLSPLPHVCEGQEGQPETDPTTEPDAIDAEPDPTIEAVLATDPTATVHVDAGALVKAFGDDDDPPPPRHSRAHGTNPRALGINPRSRPPPQIPPAPCPTGPPDVMAMLEAMRAEIGETAFRVWLAPLGVGALNGTPAANGGTPVVLHAPTPFHRDHVAQHYADRMRTIAGRLVEIAVKGPS